MSWKLTWVVAAGCHPRPVRGGAGGGAGTAPGAAAAAATAQSWRSAAPGRAAPSCWSGPGWPPRPASCPKSSRTCRRRRPAPGTCIATSKRIARGLTLWSTRFSFNFKWTLQWMPYRNDARRHSNVIHQQVPGNEGVFTYLCPLRLTWCKGTKLSRWIFMIFFTNSSAKSITFTVLSHGLSWWIASLRQKGKISLLWKRNGAKWISLYIPRQANGQ